MNSLLITSQTGAATRHNVAGTGKPTEAAVATDKSHGEGLNRQSAIAQIYDLYVETIYKFVYYKVGNREDAEDITSQVFIKAAHSLDVTQGEQSKLAWLYQVARTTITDHWRAVYKAPTTSLDGMEEVAPLYLAAEPIIAGGQEESEIGPSTTKVCELMSLLPENYRQVLQLRFLEGCSLKETAAAMRITEGNAKVMQHRALQKAVRVGGAFI